MMTCCLLLLTFCAGAVACGALLLLISLGDDKGMENHRRNTRETDLPERRILDQPNQPGAWRREGADFGEIHHYGDHFDYQ